MEDPAALPQLPEPPRRARAAQSIPLHVVSADARQILQLTPAVATVSPECPIGRLLFVVRGRLFAASSRHLAEHAAAAAECWVPSLTAPARPSGTLAPCDAIFFSLVVRDAETKAVIGETPTLTQNENLAKELSRAIGGGALDMKRMRFELQYRKEATFG